MAGFNGRPQTSVSGMISACIDSSVYFEKIFDRAADGAKFFSFELRGPKVLNGVL